MTDLDQSVVLVTDYLNRTSSVAPVLFVSPSLFVNPGLITSPGLMEERRAPQILTDPFDSGQPHRFRPTPSIPANVSADQPSWYPPPTSLTTIGDGAEHSDTAHSPC